MGGRCCRAQSATKVHVTNATATTTAASKYAINDGDGSAAAPTNTTSHQAAPSTKKNLTTSKRKGEEALEISNLADMPDEPSLEPQPDNGVTRSKAPPGKMTPTASATPIDDELVPYEEDEEEAPQAATAAATDTVEEPIKSAEDVLKGYSAQLKKKKAKSSANLIYAPTMQLDSRDNQPDPNEGHPSDRDIPEGETPKVFSRPF